MLVNVKVPIKVGVIGTTDSDGRNGIKLSVTPNREWYKTAMRMLPLVLL